MLSVAEWIFYALIALYGLLLLVRAIQSQMSLKSEKVVLAVVEGINDWVSFFKKKVFGNIVFIILGIVIAYDTVSNARIPHSSFYLIIIFAFTYFDWYSSLQKLVITESGINIGVDQVQWEDIISYFWQEEAFEGEILLRIKRKKGLMPFSFKMSRSDQQKVDEFLSKALF